MASNTAPTVAVAAAAAAATSSGSAPASPTSPTAGSFRLYDPSSKASSKRSSRSNLSIDLSAIPPLMTPSPPTNTLLITNLKEAEIFHPDHLQSLRDIISSSAPLASWSPLKSFARIVCSFYSEEEAIKVRGELDGEFLMGHRMRIYFGTHTPVNPAVDQHLQAPESQKLFFISPPPSPPVGWESRNEEPPNTLIMPEDLASALSKLSWNTAGLSPSSPDEANQSSSEPAVRRQRSGSSTVLFEPTNQGGMAVPGVTIDDFSDDESASPNNQSQLGITHTARPPVETMHDA
ncbi:Calcipressin-2 [Arthrobotrys entomopaga]|nr:Calcipressin-2 [Arthrobotrys entomopaga]